MNEPTAISQLRHLYQNMVNGAVRDTASAKRIAEGLLAPAIEALERGTPQPTQAQAGAVPLTDEQLLLLRFATSSLFHLFERWNKKEIQHYQLMDEMGRILEHVIRRTVVDHGIKGGQHGADT